MNPSAGQDWVSKLLSVSSAEQEDALARLHGVLLERIGRAFRSNPKVDDSFVEDVVQDGIVSILDCIHDFQGRSQFMTWATTITVRIAISEMRRRRWKDVSLDELLENSSSQLQRSDQGSTVDKNLQQVQLVATMHEVINEQLTEKQRLVLKAELEGMPQEEIGRRIGSNRNAIYKLTHDARKRLKKGMIEAGYSAEDLALFKEKSK